VIFPTLLHLSLTFDFDTLFLVMVSTNRTIGTTFSESNVSLRSAATPLADCFLGFKPEIFPFFFLIPLDTSRETMHRRAI
jgi:hypothetical protein